MRVAALDIGTNTALMLIAERGENSSLIIIRDEHSIARLGEGVDKTHRISDAAYSRLHDILTRYKVIIDESNIDRVVAVGTSAMRDATNRNDIISRVKNEFGIAVDVISGIEEAHLTYRGATFEIPSDSSLTAVIDIGGGSTEIAFGDGKSYQSGKSIDIGAVRLTEQDTKKSNLEEKRSQIHELLSNAFPTFTTPHHLVAVAGTPTALSAMNLGLATFDANIVNGSTLTDPDLDSLLPILYTLTPDELTTRYPAIAKGRADILPAGALILSEAMKFLGVDHVRVSTRGLRYGVALNALD